MNGEKHRVWVPGETVRIIFLIWFVMTLLSNILDLCLLLHVLHFF